MAKVFYNFKSAEEAGATQINSVAVDSPLPDAPTFGTALAGLIAGDLVSITEAVGGTDYTTPYPDATGNHYHFIARGTSHSYKLDLYDCAAVDVRAALKALAATGTWLVPGTTDAVLDVIMASS